MDPRHRYVLPKMMEESAFVELKDTNIHAAMIAKLGDDMEIVSDEPKVTGRPVKPETIDQRTVFQAPKPDDTISEAGYESFLGTFDQGHRGRRRKLLEGEACSPPVRGQREELQPSVTEAEHDLVVDGEHRLDPGPRRH